MNRPMRMYILIALIIAGLSSMASRCKADDTHHVYVGTAWTHLSNFDAGPGYNDEREDSADHVGIDIEYQYHLEHMYFFSSIGVGKSRVATKHQTGWDCSGCSYPAALRFGWKMRIN